MSKRELTIYIYLAVLAVAFVAVSTAIILMGNRPKLVKTKLKVGATIIALNTMIMGCGGGGLGDPEISCYDTSAPIIDTDTNSDSDSEDIEITCYEVAVTNDMYLELPADNIINLDETTELEGVLYNREGTDFAMVLVDSNDELVQTALIEANDGAFDNYNEQFVLTLADNLAEGQYTLKLFASTLEDATAGTVDPVNQYLIELIHGGTDTATEQ